MIIKGKAKDLLEDSLSNALIAVEIYNKPRLEGKIKSYVVHMIIAWTKAFHTYYHRTIGERYFYKETKSNKYQRVDGEKKAWELKTCMDKYKNLSKGEYENLDFFIKLRNKIEHTYINCSDLEIKIFGECQSLLYNYENFIIKNFGNEYSLNTSLPFSLQFSELRNSKSYNSSKRLLSKEMVKINEFIDKYRDSLSQDVYNTQEYSIKLVQVPIVSNTSRNDIAVQFLNWDKLSESEKEEVTKITTLIKNKNIFRNVGNIDRYMPKEVELKVKEKYPEFSININTYLVYIFSIKPSKSLEPYKDPFDTNTKYCFYDQAHKDHQYTDEWIEFVMHLLNGKMTIAEIKKAYRQKNKFDISDYEE